MKMYGEVEVGIHLLISALDGGEWPASCLGFFTPEERVPSIHSMVELDTPQNWSGHCEKGKNLLFLQGNQTMIPQLSSPWPVIILTDLCMN
jgi:hypothetical protein